jgi:putative ABC transport system permease protein
MTVALRHVATRVAGSAALAVLGLIYAAAWLLSPFQIGRLLLSVSVPRLAQHRLRTTLTVLGIALGVAMFIAVVGVNRSIMRGVSATFQDISGKTDLQIGAGASGFHEDLLARVRATPGVATAVPILQQNASVRLPRANTAASAAPAASAIQDDNPPSTERLLVLGVDMLEDEDAQFRDYGSPELKAIRDDPVAFLNSPSNILIGRSFAERHGYALRDKIALVTAAGLRDFEIWGFLDDSGVGRAFGGAVALMYYQAMQVSFERDRNVDRIDVALAPGASASQVEAALTQALGAGFTIEEPARSGERVEKMLSGVGSALTIASLIALLVGAFLIHNTMAISVVQRKREIGILRAIASTRSEVVRLLTLEGALLGVAGALLGVGLGIALSRTLLAATAQAISQAYLQLATTEAQLDPRILILGFVLGVFAATVASWIPARRAVAQEPVVLLRSGGILGAHSYSTRPTRSDFVAAVLIASAWPLLHVPVIEGLPMGPFLSSFAFLAAGALLMPRIVQLLTLGLESVGARFLGLEARLAHQNLPRDIARTATTAGALMAGVSLAVSFSAFTSSFSSTVDAWLDQTLPGDLFITQSASMAGTSSRNVPMDDSMHAGLAALPEVEDVRRVRITEMPYGGMNIKVVGTEIAIFMKHARMTLLEGEQDEVIAAQKAGAVLVSENFARRFGVHRGDTLTLASRKFPVAGVVVDYTSDVGTLVLDRAVYVEAFGDARVDTYELYLKPGHDAEATRRTVDARYGAERDLYVLTNGEFRAEVNQTTDQVFTLMRALELVALIVAVLGIVNAQLANVLDRIREIGVLRALGMLRRQARRMIVIEASLIGAIGMIAGVIVGSANGYLLLAHINLVQTGWYFPYRISPLSILEIAVLIIPASALAGFYPAQQAAQLVITDALDYE